MTYAEKAQRRLNALPEGEQDWWNLAIHGEGYDQDATVAADPANRNEVAVYTDGSRLEYIEAEHLWVAVQEE
jgi:predicted NAD/FAD-binding protein